MLDALSGRWLRCYGDSTNAEAYVGVEIDRSGTWHYLALNDGGLIEQTGFRREGTLFVIDTSAMNSGLGYYWRQVDWEFGPRDSGPSPSVQFSNDRSTLRLTVPDDGGLGETLFDDIYRRTQMAVADATITCQDGERAGDAACAEGEAHLRSFTSAKDMRNALSGSWTICSGGLRRDATAIAFSTDGTYRHLDKQGTVVVTGRYKLEDAGGNPGCCLLRMTDDDTTDAQIRGQPAIGPYQSLAPLKLWLDDDVRTVLSAMP